MTYDFDSSFDSNTQPVDLRDARVTIEGKAGGREVKLTGNIKDCAIKVKREIDNITTGYSNFNLLASELYILEFDTNPDNYAYKVEIEQKWAKHRVTLEAENSSLPALEKARVAAGAPENAQVSVPRQDPSVVILESKVDVTFTWKTNV